MERRPSEISGHGMFAKEFILAGEIIGNKEHAGSMNDGLFKSDDEWKLSTFLVKNKDYESVQKIKEHVNSRLLSIDGQHYAQAIKDIQPGEEILRYYGLDFWIIQAIKRASRIGYANYLVNGLVDENFEHDWKNICRVEKFFQLLETKISKQEFQDLKNLRSLRKLNQQIIMEIIEID